MKRRRTFYYLCGMLIMLGFNNLSAQCSATPITPGGSAQCFNFSDFTSYSGSSPCQGGGFGGGFGGSGTGKVIPFCTNSNASCFSISASGLPGSGGVSIALYSTCSGNPPSLGGYVSGSASCFSDAANLVYTTSGSALSPNTCYYAYIWSKNGFPVGSSFCTQTENPTYDYCTNPAPLGTSSQSFNNYCYTTGSNGSYTEPPPSQFCAGTLENNAWYTFTTSCSCTAPCQVTGTVSGITCYGGGAGFQLGFWSGSCSSLSYLGCTSGSGGTVTFTINSLSPCQVVYLGMDGNAGANCSYDITMSNVLPLPIELIRFTAQNENGYNRIGWSTATEKDNAYFTLEKSEDGIHFEVLQKVQGAGTSYVPRFYEVLDHTPFDRTYYQLSQTDYDGTTKRLGIVVVDNKNTLPESINITPNPAQENALLSFQSNTINAAEIRITDITGKVIESQNVELGIGKNEFHLNTSLLEKGVYFVSVYTRYSSPTVKLLKN